MAASASALKRGRRLALAASWALLFAAPAAHAADFVRNGLILVPAPVNHLELELPPVKGVTETMAPCNPSSLLQGGDGYWIQLPSSAPGRQASVTDGSVLNDADAYFYNAACQFIPYLGMAQVLAIGLDLPEVGTVPAGAAWVVVNLRMGAYAPITFTVFGAG